jgi:serine/threonine protein kinase/tetratricopeptide (TPR) repeat protein
MREKIGVFKLLRRLGEGGMGVVYAAHDERLDRRVAIKMIRQESSARPESRERLWREARAAARINHPNVCQLYDVGEDNGDLYLAMELLEGEPLSARIERGPMPLADSCPIVLGVLAALEALHRDQVVHRDLKPSNVFLTPHGVKLLDFGLARPLAERRSSEEATLTRTGYVLGTPRYMAPEQWRGEEIDHRVDLFAAGALLYEMLTGEPAFPGHSPVEVRQAALTSEPRVLSGPPAVAAIDRVIRRALMKKRSERYPDAPSMAEEVRCALRLLNEDDTARVRTVTRLIVLPFRALKQDADTEFLLYSLPDAISASLSGIETLVVRSSLAAGPLGHSPPDLKRIAEETEVDLVLTGTLLRAGDQVRVSAQLLEAPAGTVVCSHTAQGSMGDMFQLQDDFARKIVEAMALPLSGREHRALQQDVPSSAKAYEFYLRANQLAVDSQSWRLARDLYRSALEEDPKYAPAWAQLGRIYRLLPKYFDEDAKENYMRSADAFHRALELSPDLPLAHNLYTYLEVEMGQAKEAMVRLLKRARDRGSDPALFAGLVQACRYCGLLEASVAAYERVRRLDRNLRSSAAYTYWMLGDYERVLTTDHEHIGFVRSYALVMMGRTQEALEIYHQHMERAGHPSATRIFGSLVNTLSGNREEALATLRRISLENFRDPEGIYFIARTYAYMGSVDEALATLERAVEGGFYPDQLLARDPWLDPVRGEPRFVQLLRRAEARHREAQAAFLEHEGDRLLGMSRT